MHVHSVGLMFVGNLLVCLVPLYTTRRYRESFIDLYFFLKIHIIDYWNEGHLDGIVLSYFTSRKKEVPDGVE